MENVNMVEIKSGYKIKDDLTVEDDGFQLNFTEEEIKRLVEIAEKEGKSINKLMKEMVANAMQKAESEAADELIKRVEEYQHRKR